MNGKLLTLTHSNSCSATENLARWLSSADSPSASRELLTFTTMSGSSVAQVSVVWKIHTKRSKAHNYLLSPRYLLFSKCNVN